MKKKVCLLILIFLLVAGVVSALLLYRFRHQPMAALEQMEPPDGAQLLYFPMEKGLITAGYQNRNYLEKYGYPHYGIDVTAAKIGRADVLSPGYGIVLGTEHCDNNLGYIAVIRHDDVYAPQTGEILSLIGRYYHMTSLSIAMGDSVVPGQVIGSIETNHEWHHHIHLELDADLEYPFHTPQVAEASSELLHRYPASGEQILEPISVLVVGREQQISVHPNAKSCAEKDWPRYGAE